MNYKDFNDNELVYMVKENDDMAINCIYNKYKPIVKAVAKKYNFKAKEMGLELDDLFQEGMIGLCQAMYNFNQEKDNIFYTYASVSIKRTIIKLINYHSTKKKSLLNESISYDDLLFDNLMLIDTISDNKVIDPLDSICCCNFNFELRNFSNNLSFINSQVFELKLNGFRHNEIAELLDISEKLVDNICTAIRKRIRLKKFDYLSF